jgi:TM2 domain-containing membrane protein YozV
MASESSSEIIEVREIHHYHPTRDPGLAVVLELVPGVFLQTFGIGNIYAGNVAGGILFMIGYWVLQTINIILCFVLIGIVTLPLTWIAFMIICPIVANGAAKRRVEA